MGYTTEFVGKIKVDPPLSEDEAAFLREFADKDHRGEDLPGYYCQWVPTQDRTGIEWDEEEKFYDSVEWMKYLIDTLYGDTHTFNGVIEAQGEDPGDIWRLVVTNNVVVKQKPTLVWPANEEEDVW
jgi:hypothetical protein